MFLKTHSSASLLVRVRSSERVVVALDYDTSFRRKGLQSPHVLQNEVCVR